MKLIHLINPFTIEKNNPSYLDIAQPITLKSMLNAKTIFVDFYAVIFEEDKNIVPKEFKILPYLKRSTKDYYNTNKKLPFIQDIFDSVKNENFDYLIFTNIDIGVQPTFYHKIKELIEEGYDNFIINRRDNIPKELNGILLDESKLEIIYQQKGEPHCGWDCFIINKKTLLEINLGKLFLGYPPWGKVLKNILEKKSYKFKVFKDLYETFHLGKDKSWKNNENFLKNINIENSLSCGQGSIFDNSQNSLQTT